MIIPASQNDYAAGFADGYRQGKKDAERKKGRWIDGQCSICGCDIPAYIIDWKWQKDMDANFCPNCGADMRGEEK